VGSIVAKSKLKYLAMLMGGFMLFGCGTPVYTIAKGPNEYTINATAPGGMYGGFIGATPSESALTKRAAELCPHGYDKTGENRGSFEGAYIGWTIHCHGANN
jgi:hypothetical protein